MFQRILISGLDDRIRPSLRKLLGGDGIPVRDIQPGEPVGAGDLVLCDVGEDWSCLACWRGAMVVVYSPSADPAFRLAALRAGADDYWKQPLPEEEIAVRVAALGRRCGARVRLGAAVVDFSRGLVERNGQHYALSMKEALLLRYLTERPGVTLTRADLLRDALGFYSTLTRTLDMHVSNLRKKIESDAARPRFIVTVPRAGYKYVPEGK